MKKIILATAIIFTAGIATILNKNDKVKKVKETETMVAFADKSILGTAD